MNSYGFRVMTAGIDLTSFTANPIMLWNHARGYRESVEDILPIGYWDNISVENGALYADAVFSSDDFAQRIAKMVDEGTLRASSIGLRVVETSEDPSVLLQGQTRSTVTKCTIRECSIVDIPSNINAIALYDEGGKMINLSDNEVHADVPKLSLLSDISNDNILTMKKVCKTLKLADTVSEEVVVERIENLQDENVTLKAEIKRLSDAQAAQKKAEVKTLLDTAVTEKRIAETERPAYEQLFDANFEAAKTVLAARTANVVKLSDIPKTGGVGSESPQYMGKTWLQLQRENPATLKTLKAENIALFKAMYKADLGVEYVD